MKIKLILTTILIVAFFLRVINININPPAVYGDELSFAWNAWNILKTGTDEYGMKLPLQFRAFDDYKSPIPVYLLVPVFAVFGMNELSLRLPVSLVGTVTVLATYLLVKTIFSCKYLSDINKKKSISIEYLALVSAALLAISPWHIHLSRGYFESTLSLLPFIIGIIFFIKALDNPKLMTVSLLSFSISLYTYFTPRITLLLFLPFLILLFKKQILSNYKKYLLAIFIFTLVNLPLVKMAVFDKGGNRLSWFISERMNNARLEATQELVNAGGPKIVQKALHNRYFVLVRNIANDYFIQFSIDFWYLSGDNSLRYFLGKMGMFYMIEMPFLMYGIYMLFKKNIKTALFLIGWLLIMPIPAAISGKPYAVRSLSILPVPFIFVSYGILEFLEYLSLYHGRLVIFSKILISLIFLLSLGSYVLRYHFDYIKYGATWWGWENKAAIEMAVKNLNSYDQVFISNFYTGADLALAFYLQYDPTLYREVKSHPVTLADNRHLYKFGKIYIGSLDIDEKRLKSDIIPSKSLYIGRPEEAEGASSINAPDDGRVLFKIYYQP